MSATNVVGHCPIGHYNLTRAWSMNLLRKSSTNASSQAAFRAWPDHIVKDFPKRHESMKLNKNEKELAPGCRNSRSQDRISKARSCHHFAWTLVPLPLQLRTRASLQPPGHLDLSFKTSTTNGLGSKEKSPKINQKKIAAMASFVLYPIYPYH